MRAPPPELRDDRDAGFYSPGSSGPAAIQLDWLGDGDFTLAQPFEYVEPQGRSHLVHPSEPIDLASIPIFLTWLVPKDGTHTPAAILHDTLIGGRVAVDYDNSDNEQIDDRHADYLFREAMKHTGVGWVRRWLMWSAVSLRSLTVETARAADGRTTERMRWGRIGPVAVALIGCVIIATIMALDVPDVIDSTRWFDRWSWTDDIDVFGSRSWFSEVVRGVACIAFCGALVGLVLGLVSRNRDGLAAGAIGGTAVGLLGLPMLSSAIGYAMYLLIEFVVRLVRRAAGLSS